MHPHFGVAKIFNGMISSHFELIKQHESKIRDAFAKNPKIEELKFLVNAFDHSTSEQ